MTSPAHFPDRDRLLELIVELAVVHGKVTLSSGREADWYIDMRRLTLHHEGAPLVGRVMRQLTRDLRYDVVGGLTLSTMLTLFLVPTVYAMLEERFPRSTEQLAGSPAGEPAIQQA